jgi:hypothetical protein
MGTRPAMADEWDKRTKVTFSGPVEIPGRVLEAGTYVFRLMDSPSDRHIVQVYNSKETHLITTLVAVPDERLQPRGKTVIMFDEAASGSPEALRAWFYPGDNIGQEFVYPESKAREIAQKSHEHVLYMRDQNGDVRKGEIRAVEPSGQEENVEAVHKKH